MSRTLFTSLTLLLTVVALQFLGGTVIHDFAVALTFGVVVGTYSALRSPCRWSIRRRRDAAGGIVFRVMQVLQRSDNYELPAFL